MYKKQIGQINIYSFVNPFGGVLKKRIDGLNMLMRFHGMKLRKFTQTNSAG